MPVNNPCSVYSKNLSQWELVRDCVEGETAIKSKGDKYLPRLPGQSEAAYAAYKERPKFFDGTSRTAEGLHGHIFSKDPVQNGEISEAFKELLEDVDASGTGIDKFANNITWEAMQAPWGGILVDYTPVPEGVSKAESNARAYLKWYNAEDVIRWRYSVINGAVKLVLVVLREDQVEQDYQDEFETKVTEAYRVLSFDADGYYIQRVFTKFELDETGFLESKPIYPQINNEKLRDIPFYTCPGEEPEKSMLLGLAVVNIGHYQKSADYENGLHFTGVPTPIAENMPEIFDENGKPRTFKLGGTELVCISGGPEISVNVKFLEFNGAGLGQLRLALNDDLDKMAKLGIQSIGPEKRQVETAEVASIHRSAENGLLGAFAMAMSDKITQAVRLMAKWNGIAEADSWSYELNNVFDHQGISNQILQIMHSARMSGELPRSAWFAYLKRIGILPEDIKTYDDFLSELQNDPPINGGPKEEEPDFGMDGGE